MMGLTKKLNNKKPRQSSHLMRRPPPMGLGARLPGDPHVIKYTLECFHRKKYKIAVDAFYLILV